MEEKILYLVTHIKGQSEDLDDFKIIGVFDSEEEANSVVDKLKTVPDFSDFPDDFNVGPYVIGKNYWEDGFGPA